MARPRQSAKGARVQPTAACLSDSPAPGPPSTKTTRGFLSAAAAPLVQPQHEDLFCLYDLLLQSRHADRANVGQHKQSRRTGKGERRAASGERERRACVRSRCRRTACPCVSLPHTANAAVPRTTAPTAATATEQRQTERQGQRSGVSAAPVQCAPLRGPLDAHLRVSCLPLRMRLLVEEVDMAEGADERMAEDKRKNETMTREPKTITKHPAAGHPSLRPACQ